MTPLQSFIAELQHEPADNHDPHEKLFSDLKTSKAQELFDLYQWGCVEAQWNETEHRTEWQLNDFGKELLRKNIDEMYFHMMRNKDQYTQEPNPTALRGV